MSPCVAASGVPTYYEVCGDGDPVVLLHGGLSTVEDWAAQTPALAARYRVYAPERRGHGRTPDVDGPISYDVMAADTAAFIEGLEVGPAHLIGWSDGAVVGALVALRRPELVRKLVLIGQYFNADGMRPGLRELLASWESTPPPALHAIYDQVSPDGAEHFPIVLRKVLEMWRAEPDLALAELARMRAQTLVMQGDNDAVRVEHSAGAVAALPDAQLAVLPGTSHAAPLEKPDLVNRLILDFLAEQRA